MVIGVVPNAVATSLVNDVIMQVIAAIVGKPIFDTRPSPSARRDLLRPLPHCFINFLIIAATLFVIIRSEEFRSVAGRR